MYSSTEALSNLIVLIRKKTPEFVDENETMVDKDPSKSIRFRTWNIGVSAFLIKPEEHEKILYFLYKTRKSQFLLEAMKHMRKYPAAKFLNKLRHLLQQNMLCFLSDEKILSQDRMVTLQNNRWPALSPQNVLLDIKKTPSPHYGILGSSLVMVTSCLHSSSQMASDSKQRLIFCVWRRWSWFGSRLLLLKDPTSGNRTPCHTSKRTKFPRPHGP